MDTIVSNCSSLDTFLLFPMVVGLILVWLPAGSLVEGIRSNPNIAWTNSGWNFHLVRRVLRTPSQTKPSGVWGNQVWPREGVSRPREGVSWPRRGVWSNKGTLCQCRVTPSSVIGGSLFGLRVGEPECAKRKQLKNVLEHFKLMEGVLKRCKNWLTMN